MSSLSETLQAVNAVRAVRNQRLRSKNTVNHMNTRTTVQTEEAAEKARRQLEPIMEKIVNQLNSGLDISQVRQKYKDEVGSILAEMVRTSYMLGHSFIEQYAGRTILFSESSLQKMNYEIDQTIEIFWTRTANTFQRQQEKKRSEVLGAAGEDGVIAAFFHFVSQMATSLSFKTLSSATIETRQTQYRTDIFSGGRQAVPALLIWVSERDNRVCPICLNLDGRTFDANDPTIPTPGPEELGGATHWGCRCRQLPEIDGKAFNG